MVQSLMLKWFFSHSTATSHLEYGMKLTCRFPNIGLVQKLDQVLYLLLEQSKETSVIMAELRALMADVNELQESSRSASTSSIYYSG